VQLGCRTSTLTTELQEAIQFLQLDLISGLKKEVADHDIKFDKAEKQIQDLNEKIMSIKKENEEEVQRITQEYEKQARRIIQGNEEEVRRITQENGEEVRRITQENGEEVRRITQENEENVKRIIEEVYNMGIII
jgi:cell division septum initiation protein DivIVA